MTKETEIMIQASDGSLKQGDVSSLQKGTRVFPILQRGTNGNVVLQRIVVMND